MLRQIIKPTSTNYTIKIPEEYLNQNIEILVLPFDSNIEINHNAKQGIASEEMTAELNELLESIRLNLDPAAKNMTYDELRFKSLQDRHI